MSTEIQLMLQELIKAFRDLNFDKSNLILRESLEADLRYADPIFQLGIAYAKANGFREALAIFTCMESYIKDDPRIYYNIGLIYSMCGCHQDALNAYDLALSINPADVETLINKGSVANDINNYTMALQALNDAIAIRPDIAEAWSNKGIALNKLHLYQDSVSAYNEALRLDPGYYQAWSNKSAPLNKLKRFLEAIESCDKALGIKPDYAEAYFNKGITLGELKRYDEALIHYDRALGLKPDYAEAYFNKGVILGELKRYEEALTHYDRALSLKPDNAKTYFNKSNILHDLKRYDEALTHYDRALSLKPDYAEAYFNKGVILAELKRYEEALTNYEKVLSINPDFDWANGEFLHTKMKICSWINFQERVQKLAEQVQLNQKVILPFQLLSLIDDAKLHKKSSEIYIYNKYPPNPLLGSFSKRLKKDKIRLAYFSPDFQNHPVAFLTSELFELHDRSRFEIFAFSLHKAPDADPMRLRLRKGFDHFIDVENMSELEIAELARSLEIDIAIDLAGTTAHSRMGIFSYRAAPIQINWLGYPGTIGAKYIDYIVADSTLIPESSRHFFTEKVAYLPNTYMVDDTKRVASSRVFTREECSLPDDSFVFCCFNNDYKFNEKVLGSWSRILKAVEKSVLWISNNNELFKKNIVDEFDKRGIRSDRIIFAQRVELMADHLARYQLADLFLDTCPYNAHTTAVDSLKAGTPVLTLIGQSFASRVAASLLNAIGLPDLITRTQDEYESLAIYLARDRHELNNIKARLKKSLLTSPLFDTPLFTNHLEAAYIEMYQRYQMNLQPDHIYITH